ncbi:D-glycero-beta-D-manno-heptose 1-phosphate adenylyltransferase [Thermodesulfatator atlanticus]|uniref:D-glycero-beta-D-manno-heptose 1-phosphate adenylyltransferase n=1 Tax=Thermodesulfatator atlanticus TaxID=501497 RepID=UPI00048AD7CC
MLPLDELLIRSKWQRQLGQKMVFTNGCFDILHAGHVNYLAKARAAGDFLVVGLNSDASVKRIKGPLRPVNPEKMRAQVLASLSFVDYVTIFEEDTPEKLIKALKPDVLVKGADWPEEKIVGASFVKSYGGRVLRIPFEHQISTSQIIAKIKDEA